MRLGAAFRFCESAWLTCSLPPRSHRVTPIVTPRTRLFTGSLVCGRPNAIVRAAPAAGSWLRRFSHRLGDTWTLLTFSLSPSALLSPSARLHVGGVVLQLAQWPGSKVGSGGYLWGASRRLASWLETNGDGDSASSPSRLIPGLKLLELGAGTGALGLAAAVLGANVTITDQASFCFPTGINERPGALSWPDGLSRGSAGASHSRPLRELSTPRCAV